MHLTGGNKDYYFKPWTVLCTAEGYWRYPLKDGLALSLCSGFIEERLKHMAGVAADSRVISVQVAQKKMDKKDDSDTLFKRLSLHLAKLDISILHPCITAIIQFYVSEDRPLNRQVITGYALTYLVKEKHISAADLAAEWSH